MSTAGNHVTPNLLLLAGVLLGVLLVASPESASGQHIRQQLRDQRRLQADYWLKVAAKHLSNSETANTPACSADYGEQYIRRWNKLQGIYCNASSTTSGASTSSSSVTCHAHPEADISTCIAHNLVLKSSPAFLGNKDGIPGLPNPQPGSIQLACNRTADPKAFLRGRLQSNEGSRLWLVQAPQFGVEQQQACSAQRIIQHPVLFLMRVDPENAFHNLENVVSVFAALATLQLPAVLFTAGMEVVVADDRLPGYFLDVWHRLSHPHPLILLREQPFPAGTCFSTVLLAPYTAHTQSLLTYKAGTADEVFCESVVAHAVSLWLRHLFRDLLPSRPGAGSTAGSTGSGTSAEPNTEASAGSGRSAATSSRSSSWRSSNLYYIGPAAAADLAPLQPTPTQSSVHLQHLHVLWLSRSRYERQNEAQLTGWQRARQLPAQQHEQLLLELQRVVLQWNEKTCVPRQQKDCSQRTVMFTLQVAELSELPFYPDQISLLMRTGVLLGVHGAGLANQIYMAPRLGAVIEVWHNMENNYHYHNLAHMLGHKYYNVKCDDSLNVEEVVHKLLVAMDAVAAARAAAAARKSWWSRAWPGR